MVSNGARLVSISCVKSDLFWVKSPLTRKEGRILVIISSVTITHYVKGENITNCRNKCLITYCKLLYDKEMIIIF